MTETAETAQSSPIEFKNGATAQAGSVSEHAGLCSCDCCSFQSPFNIRSAKTVKLPDDIDISLYFSEQACAPHKIERDNPRYNTVMVDTEPETESRFRMSRRDPATGQTQNYEAKLAQFHTHVKAEHLIDGTRREGELHFVFKDDKDEITVVAVTVREGKKRNKALENVLTGMGSPTEPQDVISKAGRFLKHWVLGRESKTSADPVVHETVGFKHLIPKHNDIFVTQGSLTTPNEDNQYQEGVRWVVFKEPISATRDQIERFTRVIGSENHRPEQPSENRLVYRGKLKDVTVEHTILSKEPEPKQETVTVSRKQIEALPAEYRARLLQQPHTASMGKG